MCGNVWCARQSPEDIIPYLVCGDLAMATWIWHPNSNLVHVSNVPIRVYARKSRLIAAYPIERSHTKMLRPLAGDISWSRLSKPPPLCVSVCVCVCGGGGGGSAFLTS